MGCHNVPNSVSTKGLRRGEARQLLAQPRNLLPQNHCKKSGRTQHRGVWCGARLCLAWVVLCAFLRKQQKVCGQKGKVLLGANNQGGTGLCLAKGADPTPQRTRKRARSTGRGSPVFPAAEGLPPQPTMGFCAWPDPAQGFQGLQPESACGSSRSGPAQTSCGSPGFRQGVFSQPCARRGSREANLLPRQLRPQAYPPPLDQSVRSQAAALLPAEPSPAQLKDLLAVPVVEFRKASGSRVHRTVELGA